MGVMFIVVVTLTAAQCTPMVNKYLARFPNNVFTLNSPKIEKKNLKSQMN